jgi:hypothetical protein
MVVLALLVAGLAGPTTASGQAALPEVAGSTRIVAQGTAGLALSLPAEVAHSRGHYQASISGGTFAYVWMVPESCPNLELQGSCLSFRGILMPQSRVFPENKLVQFDTVPAGRLEVYVISDGTVTVDMSFDELDGSAAYVAEQPIDGRFQALPRECPQLIGDCTNLGYGGATQSVGASGGVAVSIAYAEAATVTGSISVQSCVSPGPRAPAGSADPADHPEGCPFGATGTGQDYLVNYAVRTQSRATGFLTVETNPRATGPVYAGYRAHHINPLFPDGGFAGYGVWLTLGIPAASSPPTP